MEHPAGQPAIPSRSRDFICECDDPDCRAILVIPVTEFERAAARGPVVTHH